MAKPFTSFDGVDARGVRAEVHVQTGTGTVKALEENGKNILVKMSVEGLKHPVQGWTSKDENIFAILAEAKESGREISYRIEAQRKDGVPRETPIAELRPNAEEGAKHTRQIFVGADGTLSSEALTNPAEDPLSGGRVSALNPRTAPQQQPAGGAASGGGFSVEQALAGLAKARQGGLPPTVVDATAALALAAGASVEQVMAAGVDEQTTQQRREIRRAVASEAKPFIAYNTDGRVNLGSYAVQAAVGAESLAADLIIANNVALAEAHNAAVDAGDVAGEHVEPQPVDFKNAAALGAILLGLADRVQVDSIGGGRPDRMATSHSRARGLVYDAVKNRYPVPFGQDADAQTAWKQAIVAEATLRLQFAAMMADPNASENQPQQGQQGQGRMERQQAGRPANETGDQPQPGQAEQAQGGQVHQITQQRTVPVEGDAGFEAPTPEILARFATLASAAGFEASPDSPISGYLMRTFGVAAVRKVHGPTLDTMLTWYEQKGIEAGAEGAVKFRDKVNSIVAEAASA